MVKIMSLSEFEKLDEKGNDCVGRVYTHKHKFYGYNEENEPMYGVWTFEVTSYDSKTKDIYTDLGIYDFLAFLQDIEDGIIELA